MDAKKASHILPLILTYYSITALFFNMILLFICYNINVETGNATVVLGITIISIKEILKNTEIHHIYFFLSNQL